MPGAASLVGAVLLVVSPAMAQIDMPDPRTMSGIPRPVGDLPDGVISVRLIRGQLSNNIVEYPVELHGGPKVLTVKTDDTGRAQFSGIAPGTMVHAVATVSGERLESQEFAVPTRGGIRLMLVASAGAEAAVQPAPTTAQPGIVILGGQSRFVIELTDDVLEVYYLLEVTNNASAPVVTSAPLIFDLPPGARGATVLQGSTPQATAKGTRVTVTGSFAPGPTVVQIAYQMPYASDSLTFTQKLPAALQQVAIVAEKVGDMHLGSPQIANHRDVTTDGQVYIMANGPAIAAGGNLTFELTGLPHRSSIARTVALVLAIAIACGGAWATFSSPADAGGGARRKKLQARREHLFANLVRIETERHAGAIDRNRYAARRQELIAQLERIYRELDEAA